MPAHRRAATGARRGGLRAIDPNPPPNDGAYAAALEQIDAVVFTGRASASTTPDVRATASAPGSRCSAWRVDPDRNAAPRTDGGTISADDSAVAVLVVPTDGGR